MFDFLIEKSQWIIVAGGILTLFGTYLASKKADKESEKQTTTANSNLHLSQENKDLLKQNEENVRRIQLLTDKNIELSQAISNKALNFYNYTLGKDSYCYLSFITVDGETGQFLLNQVGKNALQDVRLEITDVTDVVPFKPLKMEELNVWKQSANFGTLIPNAKQPNNENQAYLLRINNYPINNKNYIIFSVTIKSVSHVFTEVLEVSLQGASCLTSIKLNSQAQGLIFSEVEPGFPFKIEAVK